jgi:oligopeptide/dipeptide ABC transporter ATP-binding protein
VEYRGIDLATLDRTAIRHARGGIQMVFQDPYSSLNPRMTVEELITEGWRIHEGVVARSDEHRRLRRLIDLVGLGSATLRRYPHEFSGGQRQRIGIARALAVEPDVLVCDEAVSALDVSTQAQIINLLKDVQQELHLAYVFISHDLGVVRAISDRVNVMYLGRFVETAGEDDLYRAPAHPYTKALLAAVPRPDRSGPRPRHHTLSGELPSLFDMPSGCAFRTRCWKATEVCEREPPELAGLASPVALRPRAVACYHPEQ